MGSNGYIKNKCQQICNGDFNTHKVRKMAVTILKATFEKRKLTTFQKILCTTNANQIKRLLFNVVKQFLEFCRALYL